MSVKSKEKLSVLIVPLASGDIIRLKRCIYSVEKQFTTEDMDIELEWDMHIVVNSQDQEFIQQVKDELCDKYHVVFTRSDGTPGTGKNSVFDYFRRQKNQYDYLFQIDGDDFIYPCAMRQISKTLSKANKPDIVSFQSMDWLSTNFTEQMQHAEISKGKLWLYSWCKNEPNLREIKDFVYVDDPNFGKKGRIFTPGTSMILSGDLLRTQYNLRHTNTIKLFEDYYFYLKLFNLHIRKEARMIHTNHSFYYVYDKTNEHSISTNNCFYSPKEIGLLTGFAKENNLMDKHPKDHLEFIRLEDTEMELSDKVVFVRNMVDKFPCKMKSLDDNRIKEQALRPLLQKFSNPVNPIPCKI